MTGICRMVADPARAARHVRDPADDYLVELARTARVDALVSGDKDLLVVDPAVVRVLTPREALREMSP
jgi:predicted nucleic acid-binding protein